MKLYGKTNVELLALKDEICANPENKMPAGSLWKFTAKARTKLDKIDRAITANLRSRRLLAGEYIDDSGYSGRQTNRRRR